MDCPLVVIGDFNTHIRDIPITTMVETDVDGQDLLQVKYLPNADRSPVNFRSRLFLDYAKEGDLMILNGLDDLGKHFPVSYTFERHCHSSVQQTMIDYCLVQKSVHARCIAMYIVMQFFT